MMAKEYKKRGGGYHEPKSKGQDKSGQNLDNWSKEEWQTKEGSGEAKQKDGSRKRYLPKKAWEEMSEKEKKETDDKKQEEGTDKQFVGNTGRAKRARKNAQEDKNGENAESGQEEKSEPQANSSKKRGRPKKREEGSADQEDAEEADGVDEEEKAMPAKKQKTSKKDDSEAGKSKPFGSKHMDAEAPAQQASNDRLPKKGHQAHWKAMPGWVDGEVVEVLKSGKKVDGKQVKASKDDPKIVLKSKSSGKICVHKPSAVYFD
jgi:hypothetical protein